ncbi:hypothetical protein [Cobetia amphilecti]|uniref:hypothetical protein n=1 Tax=Cobetia amphilecti TaxID=1055104 RepID=UPI00244CEAA2|nr:hypothetical protein [Cobetia litoralis]MDH2421708.1 hypothetical protein [Cobetia litoralis]
MRRLMTLAILGMSMVAAGCANQPTPILVPKDPVPDYISPMYYANLTCRSLQYYQQGYGTVLTALKPVVDATSLNWGVPVSTEFKALLEEQELGVVADPSVFNVFVDAWGRYIAVLTAASTQGCGLDDTYGFTPWESIYP